MKMTETKKNKIDGLTYEEIDEIILKYQEGDSQSGHNLIKIFNNFLNKYVELLKYKKANLNDLDIRRFIKLFESDSSIKKKITKSIRSYETNREASRTIAILNIKINTVMENDLRSDLLIILLTLAKRYKKTKKNVNFCGYLYSCFKYEVYRLVTSYTKDPLSFNNDNVISYNDEENLNEEGNAKEDVKKENSFTNKTTLMYDDEIGYNWINGISCSDKFEELTYTERLILKLSYVDGLSDVSISDRLCIHRNTLRQYKKNAISKIKTGE